MLVIRRRSRRDRRDVGAVWSTRWCATLCSSTCFVPCRTGGSKPCAGRLRTLTPRQHEVLALLADGLNAKAIVPRLGLADLPFATASVRSGKSGVSFGARGRREPGRRGLV